MADPITMARMALLLGDEQNRKRLGWAVAAILSPIIVVIALLCVLGSGTASHNISAAQLCFQSGEIPAEVPAEYRVCIEAMRDGYYVTIGHEGGLITLYGHNSRLLVTPGQTVQAGDVISLSGATGRVTGPHLHFEVRVNGQRTNPRYYLP